MSRHSIDVRASGMMVVVKHVKKDLGGGHLGTRQIRSTKNIVVNPRLQRINACMASALAGKKHPNLGAVQSAFKSARGGCKG